MLLKSFQFSFVIEGNSNVPQSWLPVTIKRKNSLSVIVVFVAFVQLLLLSISPFAYTIIIRVLHLLKKKQNTKPIMNLTDSTIFKKFL